MGIKLGSENVGGLKIGSEIVGGMKTGTEIFYELPSTPVSTGPDAYNYAAFSNLISDFSLTTLALTNTRSRTDTPVRITGGPLIRINLISAHNKTLYGISDSNTRSFDTTTRVETYQYTYTLKRINLDSNSQYSTTNIGTIFSSTDARSDGRAGQEIYDPISLFSNGTNLYVVTENDKTRTRLVRNYEVYSLNITNGAPTLVGTFTTRVAASNSDTFRLDGVDWLATNVGNHPFALVGTTIYYRENVLTIVGNRFNGATILGSFPIQMNAPLTRLRVLERIASNTTPIRTSTFTNINGSLYYLGTSGIDSSQQIFKRVDAPFASSSIVTLTAPTEAELYLVDTST